MICLLFAMDKEAASLLAEVKIKKQRKAGFAKIYEVEKSGKDFLIAVSGIGKAFAASCISAVASSYQVDAFYNVGVAGSTDRKKADILSCVIGSHYVEHDLDTSAIGDPVGLVSGINIVEMPSSPSCVKTLEKACEKAGVSHCKGIITSGDRFMNKKEEKKRVKDLFGSLCFDMESAPFAQIAYAYGIPFASARVISDAEDNANEYALNVEEASKRASAIALEVALAN